MSVVEFFICCLVIIIMCFVLLVVIGLIVLFWLLLEVLLDIFVLFLFVQILYIGLMFEEVEWIIICLVEELLVMMIGIKCMCLLVIFEVVLIYIEFSDWDCDIVIVVFDVCECIDVICSDLFDDLQCYNVFKWFSSDQLVLKVCLVSIIDLIIVYDMFDCEFKWCIECILGVVWVDIIGVLLNEVEIVIDLNWFNVYGLSINELSECLCMLNFLILVGQIDDNGQCVCVQLVGEIIDLQEMCDLVINVKGLCLGDIVDVCLKLVWMNYGCCLDGNLVVGLDIFKECSVNLVDVLCVVLVEVEVICVQLLMCDVQIKVIDNQGKVVILLLLELVEVGVVGLILLVMVLFFFLCYWLLMLMVILVILICFIIILGFMYFVGVMLNILIMMGLLFVVGMLVDNVVVVVESIYQECECMLGQLWLVLIIGICNVVIVFSVGMFCYCIVFVLNLFGEINNISIFMVQIVIIILVLLLVLWLVVVSLILMLFVCMVIFKLVYLQIGLIVCLQCCYVQLLDWLLYYRGWSLFGILLVVLVSLVLMKLIKVDMFGGEGGKDIFIGYMWKGVYIYWQMFEEVVWVENWIDQNCECLYVKQVYFWYSEQEGSFMVVILDEKYVKDIKVLQEELCKGLLKFV